MHDETEVNAFEPSPSVSGSVTLQDCFENLSEIIARRSPTGLRRSASWWIVTRRPFAWTSEYSFNPVKTRGYTALPT